MARGQLGLQLFRNFLETGSKPTDTLPLNGPETRLAKRIIACLDVRANDAGDLVVTKGDQYDVREEGEVRNLGAPVELAGRYYDEGADEVTFLNITGFRDFPLEDMPMLAVLEKTSENVFVPLTIGGGIRDYTDANGKTYTALEVASEYFRSGADKVSIGSDAVYVALEYLRTGEKTGKSPIETISEVYGSQAVVTFSYRSWMPCWLHPSQVSVSGIRPKTQASRMMLPVGFIAPFGSLSTPM